MSKPNEKAEAKKPKLKKPIEYQRFEKLLKQVVKAPPMKKAGNPEVASSRPW